VILASAVKALNGIVYIGHRHWNVFDNMRAKGVTYKGGVQGFITDQYRFLDRRQAYFHAVRCGQIPKRRRRAWWNRPRINMNGKRIRVGSKPHLMSETVWPHDPPEWRLGLDWRAMDSLRMEQRT